MLPVEKAIALACGLPFLAFGLVELAVSPSPLTPAVFLDRDGTLVRDFRHAADPASVELLPGVAEALQALAAAGYVLVVVTSQSGVARGLFSMGEARAMGRRIGALLGAVNVQLAGYYLCPHYVDGSVPEIAVACGCRKPAPGLLLRAARDLDLDLGRSWMIGDSLSDVAAGEAAGARAVLVDIGCHSIPADATCPPVVARNLAHAAAIILAVDGHLQADGDLQSFVQPCPPSVMHREPPPRSGRGTGVPSPWPAGARLDEARRDAERLVALVGDRALRDRQGQ